MRRMLVGRLEGEKTARGINVRIPARRGSAFALFGPVIGAWLLFASIHYFTMGVPATPEDGQNQLLWLLIEGFGVTFIILLFWAAWAFTSDTIVTLDETQFKIQRRVLGIELVTHSFSTTEVHNFKYMDPTAFRTSKGLTDIRTSRIAFSSRSKTHFFAEGVTQAEAQVLIEQILEVFKFSEVLTPPLVPFRGETQ